MSSRPQRYSASSSVNSNLQPARVYTGVAKINYLPHSSKLIFSVLVDSIRLLPINRYGHTIKMCYEWTRVWQCNHGPTPQEAPQLQLCTVGRLNLAEIERSNPSIYAGLTSAQIKEVQMRGACAYIEDVRILQAGYCARCREEKARDPAKFARELIWADEAPGTQM